MRVDVEIIPGGERHHVASAYLVFVALDENMKPMSVPPVIAETEAEKRRQGQALIRRESPLLRKQALLRHAAGAAQGDDADG